VKIYELIGKEALSEEQKQMYNSFLEAVDLYKEKNFQDARAMFESLFQE